MEAISKNFFLYLSNNKVLDRLAKRFGSRFGADKIVGGETFSQAIPIIEQLNHDGLQVTVDHLGEFVTSEEEARNRAEECVEAVQLIAENQLQSEISLKLTSLGLDISHQLVIENMEKILKEAQAREVTVTIDMEDSSRCESTLEIYKSLKKDYSNLGTVIQSYLYRSDCDIEELHSVDPYLRLVKGAYKESGKVAFIDKEMVDSNLKHLIKKNLKNGHYTAIASHDDAIINYTKQLEREMSLSKDQFEFQMLYGMRNETQKQLVKEGYTVRVYLPYGEDWYGYFMRRLAERPANVAFAIKGIFSK
ncbi:proline dehydrogenase 2 [Halobacillus andaensis]|uniref:proline dehydrogenase n=1 Tax=Halobacillus andaensis TaxID=1176239 RepID=A0A917ESH3_HALAA|nr:proline dehydrogenase family protein [Halobacillus andaensis]MBP2003178.1 proline dehydrogenase [Halobacillus andaensis]GGF08608.1 proline dehydrogenase 2 [Halobacillus andaensis]